MTEANDTQQPVNPPTKVSFLIVNWNVKEYIVPCVKSIVECTPPDIPIEIVIVDNDSSDGAREYLPRDCPQAKIIFSGENLGYGRANNLAFEHSTGEYVFILNPDTEFSDTSWTKLIDVLDEQPDVGVVGPKLILGDGSIQGSPHHEYKMWHSVLFEQMGLSRLGWVKRANWEGRLVCYPTDADAYIEALSGAAFLARRDLYAQVGGFDPDFIHGGEDFYFCKRCRELGFRIKYLASAQLHHYHNKSGAKASVKTRIKGLESRAIYFRKVEGRLSALAFRFSVLVFYCPRLVIAATSASIRRKPEKGDLWQTVRAIYGWSLGLRRP